MWPWHEDGSWDSYAGELNYYEWGTRPPKSSSSLRLHRTPRRIQRPQQPALGFSKESPVKLTAYPENEIRHRTVTARKRRRTNDAIYTTALTGLFYMSPCLKCNQLMSHVCVFVILTASPVTAAHSRWTSSQVRYLDCRSIRFASSLTARSFCTLNVCLAYARLIHWSYYCVSTDSWPLFTVASLLRLLDIEYGRCRALDAVKSKLSLRDTRIRKRSCRLL